LPPEINRFLIKHGLAPRNGWSAAHQICAVTFRGRML
jgi:hypothetical protein